MQKLQKLPKTDSIGLGIIFFIGLAALIGALSYGLEADKGLVGPGFLPAIAGIVMMLAAAGTIAKMFFVIAKGESLEEELIDPDELLDGLAKEPNLNQALQNSAQADAEPDEVDFFGRTSKQRSMALISIFAIIAIAIFLIQWIGLLLSLTLMVFAIVYLVERKGWIPALISAVTSFLFGLIVFKYLLDVSLPTGMLGLI